MEQEIYLTKAAESLSGAESEYANGRYNNAANRSYYACFQAAVHALFAAGIRPPGSRPTWSHEQLQAQFVEQLINRQKVYPSGLRDVLPRNLAVRLAADYDRDRVSEVRAARALRRARTFVDDVVGQPEERS